MKENFSIENLIKIGLIESEAKIYLNLLKKKSFTASEVSKLSGISRSKTYEILHQLVVKGLCVEILGGVKKYAPANPTTAFNGLKQKIQQELENKRIIISNLSETLLPLYHSEKENIDPLDYIKVIREKNSIVKNFESLERMATEEVLSLVKGPYAMNISPKCNPEQFTSLSKGVKYKTVYEIEEIQTPYFMEIIEMLADAGEEIRIANNLPIKMYIFDKKKVMFTLVDSIGVETSLTAMIIEHSDLARALKEIFNLYWEKSITLEEFKNKEKIS